VSGRAAWATGRPSGKFTDVFVDARFSTLWRAAGVLLGARNWEKNWRCLTFMQRIGSILAMRLHRIVDATQFVFDKAANSGAAREALPHLSCVT
jgi:hypothetical protein